MSLYERFVGEVSKYTDKIDPRKSLKRKRKGKAFWRDLFVFVRQMSSYGRKWLQPALAFTIMLSLTPRMFRNLNQFFNFVLGVEPFPVGWSSIVAITSGFLIVLIGTWGYRRGGVEKVTKEITEQQDPVYLMQFDRQEKMLSKLDNLTERMDRIENKVLGDSEEV